MIFDLLAVDGESLLSAAYSERRARLEALQLHGATWTTPATFDDGAALYAGVCDRGLEGIVGKQVRSPDRPGTRTWIKIKNPNYWRRESELQSMRARLAERQFLAPPEMSCCLLLAR